MSVLGRDVPDKNDLRWVGLIDAEQSGWYQGKSDELFRGFHISASDYVLDVGCGPGNATLFCARRGAHVTFTDVEAESVRELEAKVRDLGTASGYEAIVGDSDPLPVADESATRVICQEVLEHVADPGRVLAELVRAGKPGALFCLTVPGEHGEKIQQQFAPAMYFEHPNHIRIFSKASFLSLVEEAGLVVESYTPYGFYWFFSMSLHWAIQAAKGEDVQGQPFAVYASMQPPFDDSLQNWATLWRRMISTPEGRVFKREMDAMLPKSQVIIARKPG
ncbi:MAG: class I SAM-dependent methyltransferase [Halioglobus sp.]